MSPPPPEARAEAAGQSEALYRSLNEQLEPVARMVEQITGSGSFACECADLHCVDPIEMTVAEYERVRSRPEWFVVLPGHVSPDVERVVREEDGYVVVEKVGVAARIAEETDPRG